MPAGLRILALALALAAFGPPARAQQLAFSQRETGDEVAFQYAFRDHGGAERRLAFRLSSRDVEAGMALFRGFSIAGASAAIDLAVAAEARKAGVTATFSGRPDGGRTIRIDGPPKNTAAFGQRLEAIVERARGAYLREHLRVAEGPAIYVDYAAAVRRHVAMLRPLAEALGRLAKGLPERETAGLALAFLQSIPYDEFADVGRFGGVDYAPAPAMLKLNAGECDSKSAALGAILRTLLPQRRLVLVRMPETATAVGHALLMADLPPQAGDATLMHEGRRYVALEAAGPATVPPGVVDSRAAAHLRRTGNLVVVPVGD